MEISLEDKLGMDLDDLPKRGGRGGARGGRGARRGAGRVFNSSARDASSPVKRQAYSGDSRNRVYVHNLDWGVTWQILKDHMRSAGDVTRADVLTKPNGLSKGCGIVEYATAAQAAEAIRTLHDSLLLDRQILVREDREDRAPVTRGGASVAAGGSRAAPSGAITRIFVGNLPFRLTWGDLKDAFKHFGEVKYANVETNADGRSKGWGIVEFARAADARKAIDSSITLDGREVDVREDKFGNFRGTGRGAAPAARAAAPAAYSGAGRKVYVSNLSWDVEWQDLKDYFKSAGEVTYADVFKLPDGRSRGCGIVEFASPADATNAIETLNDTDFKGRLLYVREDNKEDGAAVAGGGGGGGGGNRVRVGNLPFSVTWQILKDEFSKVGTVTHADVAAYPDGRSKGFGFVTYARSADAETAVSTYTGATMDDRVLTISIE